MSDEESRLGTLPPSAKYVLHVLDEHDGELTRQEALEETDLSPATLDRAVETLQNEDYLSVNRDNEDLRQVVLTLRTTRIL